MELLLISGVPAAGKSHFGRWLEETKGFVHLDVELDGCLRCHQLVDGWNRCFTSANVLPFVNSLRRLSERVVVNWGFPPRFLNVVQLFKSSGVVPWWFNAEPNAALSALRARGDVSIAAFQTQMSAILEQWPRIEATFCPRIITTLSADGSRLPEEAIYERICANQARQ